MEPDKRVASQMIASMDSDPLVSIMMPAYNSERFIAQAIESVLAQTYPRWELIIVNDGSTDSTGTIAARYTDDRIHLFHQENAGEAAARNAALSHMSGEYLAFLDADDEYLPDHLEMTVRYLQQHLERHAVYTDGYHINENGAVLKSLSSRRRGPFEGWIFEELVRASNVHGPPICVVLRRSHILRYNLQFDPLIVIGPDWDFMTQYSEAAQFGYLNLATCLYRIHASNISVLTNVNKRALSVARCREKAIKYPGFARCSPEVRTAVFYDLLVNLLLGYPERQTAVTTWPEFADLPISQQARLFRLMASKAILKGDRHPYIERWFQSAQQLESRDSRAILLAKLYQISPQAAQAFLSVRTYLERKKQTTSPFSDLEY